LVGFFFQAEDGIRVFHVTGVQTCALPISARPEVPDELEAIVASALAKDRDARTADADELARQLLGFASRTGGPLRHADVAQTLRALVPDLVDREPELDRRPLAAPEPKADPVQAALLMAEADEEAEAL